MKRIFSTLIVFVFFIHPSFSQVTSIGSWNIFNVKYHINNKYNVFGEAQLRSLKFYDDFHYYEYKAGVNYTALENVILSVSAGSYQTYSEGGSFVLPKYNDELRLWPQVILLQTIGKIKIEQRYRAEFRFTSDNYRQRLRYRLGLSYLFGDKKNGYEPYQLSASNEIFFTDKEPYFERNRILFAFNYKPSKPISLQLGYLHQFDYKIFDETGRTFLQLGFFVELFGKKTIKTPIDSSLIDH